VTSLGWADPRNAVGELLWPERFDRRPSIELEDASSGAMGRRAAPAAAGAGEGGIVKKEWWRYYDALPPVWEQELLSLDAAFKGETDSDFVALGHWGRLGADVYLLDQVVAQLEFLETLFALRTWRGSTRRRALKLIEDKANGPAIISTARRDRSPDSSRSRPTGTSSRTRGLRCPSSRRGTCGSPNERTRRGCTASG
jgi:hypothetical protein